jgi:uncharacterized protein YdhG (YjbR/CyaY superfamily)
MAMQKIEAKNIDEYIAQFPKEVQGKLIEMREVIRKAAPKAEEAIKYGIPTYVLHGNLVHFGGFKNHLGFYPAPQGIQEFKKELSAYKGSKGAIQFPYDQPLPKSLITKIVKFRIAKTLEKQKAKAK